MNQYAQSIIPSPKDAGVGRKGEILFAAQEAFLEGGYSFTGMTEIATRAGMSTATVYKEFDSKEELFIEVVRMLYDRIRIETEKTIIHTGLPVEEEIMVLCVSIGGVFLRYESSKLLRMVVSEVDLLPFEARQIIKDGAFHRFHLVSKYLDGKIEEGLLKPHDTFRIAQLLMGAVRELFGWPEHLGVRHTLSETQLNQLRDLVSLYTDTYCISEV